MAVDFLTKSPTYLRVTDPEIIKRRQIVISFMTDAYKMPRGTPNQAVEAMVAAGIKTSGHVVGFDAAVYRNAFLFLTGSKEQKEKLITRSEKRTAELGGVRCLIKDGITSWDQLLPEEPQPAPAPTPPEPEEKQEDIVAITKRQLAVLEIGIARIREEVAQLETERILLREENGQLRIENQNLQASITASEDRLRSFKRMKVEDLADQFPQVTSLLELVTKPEPPTEATAKDPTAGLPKTCELLGNKSMAYSENFLKQFSELGDSGLKSTVIKALKFFAKNGPKHSGLGTRSLPTETTGIKSGNGYHIRAGRKRRITYEVKPNKIEFKAILMRGSKELPYRER